MCDPGRPAGCVRVAAERLIVVALSAVLAIGANACGSKGPRRDGPRVEVVQTNHDLSERLSQLPDVHFVAQTPRALPIITVDDTVRYQRFAGLGAAMTDSSAWLLETQLSAPARTAVITSLFGTARLGLRFVRVPMAASDFTALGRPYSYDDVSRGHSDRTLARFSVAHDDAYVIPALQKVEAVDHAVKFLAEPWSPPAWMKTNDAFDNFAGAGRLRSDAYAPLAQYFVRFIRDYGARGIQIGAITPQNEPGHPTRYPGLDLSVTDEARFIAAYLAPALRRAGLHPRIYAFDANWLYGDQPLRFVRNRAASQVAGIAWHCYAGNAGRMAVLHGIVPRMDEIVSECSTGIAPGPTAALLVAAFRNWASAVILWNLALNLQGGPVQPPNSGCDRCTAVVTVDQRRHTASYTADYFALGQLSRFVRPGAQRIESPNFVSYNTTLLTRGPNYATPGLDDVAFENPDGSKVVLAYNNASRAIRFAVSWRGKAFIYSLPAGATVTFVWP